MKRISMRRGERVLLSILLLVALPATVSTAATRSVDLDGQTANGAESQCELNVLQPFPIQIENKVTSKAVGNAYDFSWRSAGPGGFSSSVPAGTTAGVGTKWVWTTVQTVYSFTGGACADDICFAQTDGPDPLPKSCSLSCLDGSDLRIGRVSGSTAVVLSWSGGAGPFTVYRSTSAKALVGSANVVTTTDLRQYSDASEGALSFYLVRGTGCAAQLLCATDADCGPNDGVCVSRGPFGVPGRTLVPNSVTLSSGSLTSSLITFFSPPTEVFRATSAAQPGGLQETLTNGSTAPVTVFTEAFPPGCCPADPKLLHPLRCGDNCVDYLNDPANCGTCGTTCGIGTCCTGGSCASLCAPGRSWCGEACVDFLGDNENCGSCGNACGEGTCCSSGECVSVCAEGQAWCDGECVDLQNDSASCGSCGNACADGTCCFDGGCASLCGGGRIFCNDRCVDFQSDPENCGACGNACGDDGCCANGVCQASACGPGQTLCGELCYDLQNDPSHCGACGNACTGESICSGGACAPCTDRGGARNACDNQCVNIRTDPYNCGGCGISCNESCPSNFHGACSNGSSCVCVEGTPAPPPPSHTPSPTEPSCSGAAGLSPVAAVCPNPDASSPLAGACPNASPTYPAPGVCSEPGWVDTEATDAPICEVEARSTTIPAGGSVTTCQAGGLLFKEVATEISVCGDQLPGPDGTCHGGVSHVSRGTFMRLLPDPSKTVGDAYLTPYAARVSADTSGDGLLEPGESASIHIEVLNAGPFDVTEAVAALVSSPVDLTDDGIANPVAMAVTTALVPYGTIRGTAPPAAGCQPIALHPASSSVAFGITVPGDHPGDTSHPISLEFVGRVNGAPFSMSVPLSLGIADLCDPGASAGDFDGLEGLLEPMAKLVPTGDPVPYPPRPFKSGNTRPLKLRVTCGGALLGDADMDPPQIVGLAEVARGLLEVGSLNLNEDNFTDPNDPFFRPSGDGQWIFNLRTASIGVGTFQLTIRIAGRKHYVTGFALE